MNKSTFGKLFTVTTWGESHGKALGAVVDGCPAGLELDESHIQKYLNRRKPAQPEKKGIRWKFYPEYLKERQPELLFLSW